MRNLSGGSLLIAGIFAVVLGWLLTSGIIAAILDVVGMLVIIIGAILGVIGLIQIFTGKNRS